MSLACHHASVDARLALSLLFSQLKQTNNKQTTATKTKTKK